MYKVIIPEQFEVTKNDFLIENSDSDYIEDILQIVYTPNKQIVDLGFYGCEVSQVGIYRIVVIKDFDWENPVVSIEAKTKEEIAAELDNLLKSMIEENEN